MIEIFQAGSSRVITNMSIDVIFQIYSGVKKKETARKVKNSLKQNLR